MTDFDSAVSVLKDHFKTHTAAAAALGIDPKHYRDLRNGRVNVPHKTATYIILTAESVGTAKSTPSQGTPSTER